MFKYFKTSFNSVHLRHFLPDVIIIVLATYASLYLRVGADYAFIYIDNLHRLVPLILITRLLTFVFTGTYSILWRYVSTTDAVKIARSVGLGTVVIIALSFFLTENLGIPRSLFLIEATLTMLGLLGVRILRRIKFENRNLEQIRHGKRTLIYGAGYNGKTLADRFGYDVNEATRLVGFVDDDPKKAGVSIAGIKVLGTLDNLQELIRAYDVSQIIIAATNMPGEKISKIIEIARPFNIRPRIISRRLTGDEPQSNIDREIKLTDLLNRPSKEVDLKALSQLVKGKKVLVTGAGGSIGGEIARQVLDHNPGRLLILDHSEFALYNIDRELRTSTVNTEDVVPLLIDIKDRETLFSRLNEFSPDVVFHAAAYKHVHLVESNPYSSILNNIEGTKNLLDFSERNGVEAFVQISTDKAVNPAGIMGATKRVCELMTTAAGKRTNRRFCSVRFGNVLGSSGSLIPLLKEQIERGGPLTVTHKDMTRYFMLIPEAVSLVLKAGTIARPGDINVLRMGEPVRILDIAQNLITLTGKKDIQILFTGLRPGEKMYEELYIRGDELKTEHPDILTLPDGDSDVLDSDNDFEDFEDKIHRLIKFARVAQKEAIYELNGLVKSTYVPPDSVKAESEKITFLMKADEKRVH